MVSHALVIESSKLLYVICGYVLANSSLKPSLLQSPSGTGNPTQVNKPLIFPNENLNVEKWHCLYCTKASGVNKSTIKYNLLPSGKSFRIPYYSKSLD